MSAGAPAWSAMNAASRPSSTASPGAARAPSAASSSRSIDGSCLGPAEVLLEREPVRLGLPAEDVAGVHVLEPELARHEPRHGGLAAPREPGDRDQHRDSLDVLHLLAQLLHLPLGLEHQALGLHVGGLGARSC